jgi:hypothetical protein
MLLTGNIGMRRFIFIEEPYTSCISPNDNAAPFPGDCAGSSSRPPTI